MTKAFFVFIIIMLFPLAALAQGGDVPAVDVGVWLQQLVDGYQYGIFGVLAAAVYIAFQCLKIAVPAWWESREPWQKALLVFVATFLGTFLAAVGAAITLGGIALKAALLGAVLPALKAALPVAIGAMGLRSAQKVATQPLVAPRDLQSLKVPLERR
jgi:hypothetical protein